MADKSKIEKLIEKKEKMLEFERQLYEKDIIYIAGVDEVGRGCLAGPVVAAAVVLPKEIDILGIDDSKKLSEKKRIELAKEIKEKALAYSIGLVDNKVIDEINILEATKRAMTGAIITLDEKIKEKFHKRLEHILIDAIKLSHIDIPQTDIIKGDSKSISIASASILAKVTRDQLMIEQSNRYQGYGFEKNKGYGTKDHYSGIDKHGICEIHRKTFLKKYFNKLDSI